MPKNTWSKLKPFRKMNEAEKKLVKALESGKYEQTTGRLREGNAFCCLGVACDISGISTWKEESFLSESYALPFKVMSQLGWATPDGRFVRDFGLPQGWLDITNDKNYTFKQIASMIRLGAVELA